MAASPEPMAKVTEMVRLTFMPMSCAAPLSSLTARMALPIFVLLVKRVNATIVTMQVATVTMTVPVTEMSPPNSDIGGRFTTEGNTLESLPQMSRAAFWRK